MKKRAAAAAIIAAAICLSACGRAGSTSDSYPAATYSAESKDYAAEEAAYDAEGSYAADADAGAGVENGESSSALRAQDGQKIVYTGNLSIQTLEYDKSAASIRSKIKEAGGFTEAESEYDKDYNWYNYSASSNHTRSLNLTARIPSEKFESFLDSLEGDGKIMSRSMNAENISQVYANKETYKKALEKEQERLLAMMDKAETIEDMITVESRLSEVERQLNVYKTDLSQMDKDVEYSTVYIDLQEVRRYTEEVNTTTFGERVRYAFEDAIHSFKDFCEEVILFVVRNFPYLILLGIVIALIVRAVSRRRAKRLAMMTDPEYARLMNAKERAKAEAAARRRAEKESRKGRGLFGRKKTEPAAEERKAASEELSDGGEKPE